jgi:hypothetical protein
MGVQSHSEMQRLVELHFEQCLLALAARKESLLRDLDNKVNHNRMNEHLSLFLQKINNKQNKEKLIQETQTKLTRAIEGCKEVIKVGLQFFFENKIAAMTVWKVFCFVVKGKNIHCSLSYFYFHHLSLIFLCIRQHWNLSIQLIKLEEFQLTSLIPFWSPLKCMVKVFNSILSFL